MREPRFRVLVVDNDEYVQRKAVAELAELDPAIEVRPALTVDEAAELAGAEFFHLAFVDLHLGRQRGTAAMRHLNVVSPACQIFVMTRHLKEYAGEVLALLSPAFSFAGLVDKVSGEADWFKPFVEPVFQLWRQRQLDVAGVEDIVDDILARAPRMNQHLDAAGLGPAQVRRDRQALADEISWILTGLFGAIGEPVSGSRSLLTLRRMRRGFSSSVVVEALPSLRFVSLGDAVEGNRCVVKIGARPEIRKEARRYEQIVKFGLAMEHRVELLGFVEGDALAGVCYSFAGGNAVGLNTLDDLLVVENSEVWRKVLREVFAKDSSNWYSVQSEIGSLRKHFISELDIRLEQCFDLFEEWIDNLARQDVVRRNRQRLKIGQDVVIALPDKAMLAAPGLTSRIRACLVHGDLHGGNIVVDDLDKAYFIDFRNAGVGPRLIDFAALQATARFAHVEAFRPKGGWGRFDPSIAEAIAATIRREEKVVVAGPANGERWVSVVAELEAARRENFPDSDLAEALWTNFAYCLSMYRLVHMEWYRKLRLLTWLGALTLALRRSR
jgi:thiamine kinase-like enzyme/CheY-like chemotaxis protein